VLIYRKAIFNKEFLHIRSFWAVSAQHFLLFLQMNQNLFVYPDNFHLESGDYLPGFELTYSTCGSLNSDKSNVVWICHALTANSNPEEWWPGLVGAGKLFDPEKYFIVCANMLGSCYGSTYALSTNAATGQPWYHTFPALTNRDIARGFEVLRQHLGIDKIHIGIGGSLGGQQLLEWAVTAPTVFRYLIPLATNARHSPWGIAFNESQRMAIEADATWKENDKEAGLQGLRAARSVALLSYRGYEAYHLTQADPGTEKTDDFRASSYQRYQGDKLIKRFDAFAYWTLSKAMDSQNLGRGRGSVEAALRQISARTLVIGVDSDILFPPAEQQFIAQHIPHASYVEIASQYGHDGFLIEFPSIQQVLESFLHTENS